MTKAIILEQHFERNKNLQALTATMLICAGIFLLFFFVQWTLPIIEKPIISEGIEVNLGDSETGMGDIAPISPGEPAPSAANDATAAASATAANDNTTTDNSTDPDAIASTPKTIDKKTTTATTGNTKPSTKPPASNPIAAEPKPKAIFKGGTTGNGGNKSDSYNGIKNQGIAGGKGDQGNPNGNPNSDSYKGNAASGNSGVSIRSGLGGRKITRLPGFEDDFNENAKVAVDITIDALGNVIKQSINLSGTTTTNATIRSIALRKAAQLKFNAGAGESSGTILFDFKLKG